MNRKEAYLRMLGSTVDMQQSIAVMLEAKAAEAEKMRSMFCNHQHNENSQQIQLSQSLQIHEQVIQLIDGITKVNLGMVSIMKVVLQRDEEGHNDSFSFGDNN